MEITGTGETCDRKKWTRKNVVTICGRKNSGKTTLLEKLVRRLTDRGIKTAVVKHDGHNFECDVPGTDSYRFQKAGAYGTAVYSSKRIFMQKEQEDGSEEELIEMFPEADLILLEGLKNSEYPKIEVVRKGISEYPVSNRDGRFLIVTDYEDGRFDEETAGFDDIDGIIKRIMEMINS